MNFAENKNLERASYIFCPYFGTNYFDVIFLTIYFYTSFWHVIWFYYCLHIFKKKYIRTTKNMNFQTKQFQNIVTNFWRRILWRVTVVLEKESWDIRISLNTTISVQVFNEVLLISFCLSSKNKITRIIFKWFAKITFWKRDVNYRWWILWRVTVVLEWESWGTSSSIKRCRQLSICLMLRIQKFSFTIPQREIKNQKINEAFRDN